MPPKISQKEAEELKSQIQKMIEGSRKSLPNEIFSKFEGELKKAQDDNTLIDQFYEFCKEKLPGDQKYKESVLFVSLFYYFLEKKQMIS